ncbi:uncharacterized protein EI90DRAFT_297488 [Cantharellus anzutake]|uniref:uncharacterized protein n=1 Tax=Cantharellus anzutake TaxID=1750568 RepID=UPI001903A54E|nr:uncharacterized protein EI90DRAFT_297488 [Cantharellus anzutake]KAF8315989.1 hypothetical protein EI90DRAFT_297488 [Cantharellus anzutake]
MDFALQALGFWLSVTLASHCELAASITMHAFCCLVYRPSPFTRFYLSPPSVLPTFFFKLYKTHIFVSMRYNGPYTLLSFV